MQKGVEDIMGGKVLELPSDRERAAEIRGLNKGREEGREESITRLADYFMRNDAALTKEEADKLAREALGF